MNEPSRRRGRRSSPRLSSPPAGGRSESGHGSHDETLVGVTFVDLLFALVLFELLEPLRKPSDIPLEGWTHIGVATAATLLSWIGYHASRSRLDDPIRPFNPPFFHLALDVAMVVTYWLTAISYERTTLASDGYTVPFPIAPDFTSAAPEATLVAVSFLLYVGWDCVALWIHTSWADEYNEHRPPPGASRLRPVRRWSPSELARHHRRAPASRRALGVAIGLTIAAWLVQEWVDRSHARVITVAIDIALIALLFGYRSYKEQRDYGDHAGSAGGSNYRLQTELAALVGVSALFGAGFCVVLT